MCFFILSYCCILFTISKCDILPRDGGILLMCLRCDMLLLDPSFVFTATLESGSLTRLFS